MSLQSIAHSSIDSYIRDDFKLVDAKETISNLLDIFANTNSYEIVVKNQEKIEVVTVRDVLKIDHPNQTSIVKISQSLPSILPTTLFVEAVEMMVKNKIRTLRVFSEEKFLGLLLQTDLLNKLAENEKLTEFSAEEVMVTKVITADKETSAATVRNLMLRNDISHIPLISKTGATQGVVTAKDIIWYFIRPRESSKYGDVHGEKIKKWSVSISGVEDKNPIIASPKTSLQNIVQTMNEKGKSCCIIEEENKLVGIITPREILAILKEFKPEKELPLYILGVKNIDPIIVEEARKKISRVIQRGIKIYSNIQETIIRVKEMSKTGGKSFFRLDGRIYTTTGFFVASSENWSLRTAFDEIADKLNRQIRSD